MSLSCLSHVSRVSLVSEPGVPGSRPVPYLYAVGQLSLDANMAARRDHHGHVQGFDEAKPLLAGATAGHATYAESLDSC
jgi:hypothetical protein